MEVDPGPAEESLLDNASHFKSILDWRRKPNQSTIISPEKALSTLSTGRYVRVAQARTPRARGDYELEQEWGEQYTRPSILVPVRRKAALLPDDWGHKMTVCIAACVRSEQKIVTVTDLMLSTDYTSVETSAIKIQPISSTGRWISMFSGSPSIDALVLKDVWGALTGSDETAEQMIAAFERAFREQLKRKIEGELLSPYGIDRETFLREGKAYFGDEEFARLLYQINTMTLSTSFLVAGFDPQGTPRIFTISDPGVFEYHDRLGFHAIGSGYVRALGALYSTYDADLSTPDLIYRVCEAKFVAESAPGVGKKTFVVVVKPDGKHEAIFPEGVEEIRRVYEAEGKPPVSSAARAAIASNLGALAWKIGPKGVVKS